MKLLTTAAIVAATMLTATPAFAGAKFYDSYTTAQECVDWANEQSASLPTDKLGIHDKKGAAKIRREFKKCVVAVTLR